MIMGITILVSHGLHTNAVADVHSDSAKYIVTEPPKIFCFNSHVFLTTDFEYTDIVKTAFPWNICSRFQTRPKRFRYSTNIAVIAIG